jgi:hypothetical protein
MTEQIKITFMYLGNDPAINAMNWPLEVTASHVPRVGDHVHFTGGEFIDNPEDMFFGKNLIVNAVYWYFGGKGRQSVEIVLYSSDEYDTGSTV